MTHPDPTSPVTGTPMSNRRIPLLPALVVAGVLACGLSVARAHGAAEPAAGPGAREENEVVHLAMEGMKASLKKLGPALQAGQQADALAAVAALQKHALEAKAGGPSNLADKPEAERPAHALAYRRELALLLGELAALEVLVIDGKNEEAFARIKDKLVTLRDAAHEKFQKP